MPLLSYPPSVAPPLSDGETDFLWWFIQGSIMDADVRARLYAHWGLCPRHAFAFFAVEAAFRPHLIHGSTIVYHALMLRAARLLDGRGLLGLAPVHRARRGLRTSGPCHLCDLGYGPTSPGNAPAGRLAQGRDLSHARTFADANRRGWRPHVCDRCAGRDGPTLCRPHLLDALGHGGRVPDAQRAVVATVATHLGRFEQAFRWDSRGTDTDLDRGALLAAIGWCSGWSAILAVFGAARATGARFAQRNEHRAKDT